jgi:hypothetical protein
MKLRKSLNNLVFTVYFILSSIIYRNSAINHQVISHNPTNDSFTAVTSFQMSNYI